MAEAKKSAKHFENLTKPGHHGDGGGVYLRIAEGRRSWMFRYKVHGKTRWMGLGPDGDFSLADARAAARECRRQLKAGIDPIEARAAAKAEAQARIGQTFAAVAGKYIAAHKAGWRNEKHGDQWLSTLKTYAFPVIGDRPVAKITVADVHKVLEPIWLTKAETASRVRGRIEAVLGYAKAMKWCSGDNPAAWDDNLDNLLPSRAKVAKVKHHAAVKWQDLPAVMSKLATGRGMAALALRFAILTAARSGEARGARWSEIDLAAKVWVVPGGRMKAGGEHRVPLSPAALAMLEAVKPLQAKADGLVFPGGKRGSPLSDVAISKALAAVADGVTVHGFRSTFRQWGAEATSYPGEVLEACLAHVNRNKVESAYQRSDFFEKRRRLMDLWAEYATASTGVTGAIPIRQTA